MGSQNFTIGLTIRAKTVIKATVVESAPSGCICRKLVVESNESARSLLHSLSVRLMVATWRSLLQGRAGRDLEIAPTGTRRSRLGDRSYRDAPVATWISLLQGRAGRDLEIAPTRTRRSRPGYRSYRDAPVATWISLLQRRAGRDLDIAPTGTRRSRPGYRSYRDAPVATWRSLLQGRAGRDLEIAPTRTGIGVAEMGAKVMCG